MSNHPAKLEVCRANSYHTGEKRESYVEIDHEYCVDSVCKGGDCTKAKYNTCFRHLNASGKTIGVFTVTHFRGGSVSRHPYDYSVDRDRYKLY